MKRSSKYLFDKRCQYSVRKLSVGVCSVLIGSSLFGVDIVKADVVTTNQPREVREVNYDTSPSENNISNTISDDSNPTVENSSESSSQTYREQLKDWYKGELEEINQIDKSLYTQDSLNKLNSAILEANQALLDTSISDSDLYQKILLVTDTYEILEKKASTTETSLPITEEHSVINTPSLENSNPNSEDSTSEESNPVVDISHSDNKIDVSQLMKVIDDIDLSRFSPEVNEKFIDVISQLHRIIKENPTDQVELKSVITQFQDLLTKVNPEQLNHQDDRYLAGKVVDNNLHYTTKNYDTLSKVSAYTNQLVAWKNDQVNSQISLLAKEKDLNHLTVEISPLKSSDGQVISDSGLANFIEEVTGYEGNAGYHREDKLNIPINPKISYPDRLSDDKSTSIRANQVKNLWLQYSIPKDAKAGTYYSTVTVKSDDLEKPLMFTYKVVVVDKELEDKNFDIELWQYPYRLAEYYKVTPFSQEHLNILKEYLGKYKSIGGDAITTSLVEEPWGGQTYAESKVRYPSMIKWIRQNDGSFRYDYTDFDKWVGFAKSQGLGHKIVGYSMIPWGNKIQYQYEEGVLGH